MQQVPEQTVNANERTAVHLLGLYLILLAFFIMLNALAHREELRAKAVLGSVNSTFSADEELITGPVQATAATGLADSLKGYKDKLRQVYETTTPLAEFPPTQRHDQVEIIVPVTALFESDTAVVLAETDEMLEQIAELLSTNRTGIQPQIEFMLFAGTKPDEITDTSANLSILRAGAFTRDLRSRGVPDARLAPGVGVGDPDTARFRFFFRHDAANDPQQPTTWIRNGA